MYIQIKGVEFSSPVIQCLSKYFQNRRVSILTFWYTVLNFSLGHEHEFDVGEITRYRMTASLKM